MKIDFTPTTGKAWSFDDDGIVCENLRYEKENITNVERIAPKFKQDGMVSFNYKGDTIHLGFRRKEGPAAAVVVGELKVAADRRCEKIIQRISKAEEEQNKKHEANNNMLSIPDEIIKYKRLLDEGIIVIATLNCHCPALISCHKIVNQILPSIA